MQILDCWVYEPRNTEMASDPGSWERHGTGAPSEPPEEPTLLTPWLWASGLHNCERINFPWF